MATQGFSSLAPGFAYSVNIMGSLIDLAKELAGFENLTIKERRDIVKTVVPGVLKNIIANIDSDFKNISDFADPSKYGFSDRPAPGGKRDYGQFRRDDYETKAAMLAGGTIPEFKQKQVAYLSKKAVAEGAMSKADLVDKGVDALMYGGDISDVIQKGMELGYTDMPHAIIQAMKQRYIAEPERAAKGARTIPGFRRFEAIQGAGQQQ